MTRNSHLTLSVAFFLMAIAVAGCSSEESEAPSGEASGYQQIALEFTNLLAERAYPQAYALTSQEYRGQTTAEQLRSAFETIVPTDWGPMGPLEVSRTMTSWPGKRQEDLGWVYVSIGGDVYSEAITVVVTSEDGEAKIRDVEFGRP